MDDFASNAIVPSVAQGAAISEPWLTRINDIMSVFVRFLMLKRPSPSSRLLPIGTHPSKLGLRSEVPCYTLMYSKAPY